MKWRTVNRWLIVLEIRMLRRMMLADREAGRL